MDFVRSIDWLFLAQTIIVVTFAYLLHRFYQRLSTGYLDTAEGQKSILARFLSHTLDTYKEDRSGIALIAFLLSMAIFTILFSVGFAVLFLSLFGAIREFDRLLDGKSWWIQIVIWMGLISFYFGLRMFHEKPKDNE